MGAVAAAGRAAPEMPATLRADPSVVIRAAASATAARFPDADFVTVDERSHTVYEPDGTAVCWQDEWIRVLTEKGRRACASVSVSFNTRYGEAVFQCVEIVGTNGQIRAVDFARTLKTATDNGSLAMNIVDPHDRKTTCAVPGLAVGEIRHVRLCRRTRKPRMKNVWADCVLLEYGAPILSTTVTVDQPAGLPVRHAILRHPFGFSARREADETRDGGRTLLRWTVRDVPQVFPEPARPPLTRCAQTLWLSTAADWPAVSRWYWTLCQPRLAATSPALTNAVHACVRGVETRDEKIRALFRYVSQNIRYMGLTFEDDAPGYEPHDVRLTFDKKYGVCRDKAALLAAMLRIAGLDAYPVLIHAGAKMDPDVPTPYFNHAVTAVAEPDGTYRLMDPTDESTRDLMPSYLSDRSYLVARPEGERLRTSPVVPAARNALGVEADGRLGPDGALLLTSRFTFHGLHDNAFRRHLLNRTPEQRRRAFENWFRASAPGTELLSLEIRPDDLQDTETTLSAEAVTRTPDALVRGETTQSFTLPLITRVVGLPGVLLDENTALETRRFPLVLSSTAETVERLRVTVGNGAGALLFKPSAVAVTNVPGYVFTSATEWTNGVLTATRRLAVTDVHFSTNVYAALRAARQETETAERADVVFSLPDDEQAHVRVLSSETVVRFQSPTVWVSTNRTVKEVLTYRGKKASAELNVAYAPSTRAVEIAEATVSNRNGRVRTLTPAECNLMDCAWAAAAPRYPASKILVANLPGVDVGCFIRTTLVRTVTNAPTAYAQRVSFGGTSPYGRETFEWHVPHGMMWRVREGNGAGAAWLTRSVETNASDRVFRWTAIDPPRIADEPSRAPERFWRPFVEVSCGDWPVQSKNLMDALAAARTAGSASARRAGAACRQASSADTITSIRRFLAQRIRVAGPGLFELPFAQAFTPPDHVLRDGYASQPDRMNLFYAMLEGAGLTCAFLQAAHDRYGFRLSEEARRSVPHVTTFGSLLIRAEDAAGRVFWLGGENEYTPPEASAHAGDSYYDSRTDTFATVPAAPGRTDKTCRLTVRENGAADFDVINRVYGAGMGDLRKTFAEMTPELRHRFLQQMVGALAQSATATSELAVDTVADPFALSFSAYAAAYAVVQGDRLTVELPDFSETLFQTGLPPRRTPLAVTGCDQEEVTYTVTFPSGYTLEERVPEDLVLTDPVSGKDVWLEQKTQQRIEGDRLHVTVRRRTRRPRAVWLTADYEPFLRAWNQKASSRAARLLIVRKKQEGCVK